MNVKCIICNKRDFRIISKTVRDSKKHRIIECKNCEHIQLNPIPSSSTYKKFYDDDQQLKNINYNFTIKQLEKKSEVDVQRRMQSIKKLNSKKDRILEIGSGNGFFLKNMYNLEYNITGLEISKERREISKEITNAPVINHNLINAKKSLGKFDSILLFQVLEHVINPIDFLKKIFVILKKNGFIVIEVPNVKDLQIKLNSNYARWFWQMAHLNYFSKNTLELVLKRSGYRNVKIFGVQRYGVENMLNWQVIKKPQLTETGKNLPPELNWLDKYYKQKLEKNMISDTLFLIAQK
jgi:2-polyprenyl-3-methyl-5-hydroxy-6-metoxy-1,4-benzoquinol methylase